MSYVCSFALFAAIALTYITESLGYNPYGGYYGGGCGAYGGYGQCGYGSCGSYPSYPYCSTIPCLKAKILKKCLELKRPCFKKPCLPCLHKPCLPCLHKPCLPCLPCLQKPCLPCLQKPCLPCLSTPSACYKSATCFKYPPCGPCPYATYQPQCLKHKATLALCS